MNAMLLAAGLGKRMLPLTVALPKSAVPVLGRSLAVQIARRLARCGVERLVVNLHHFPAKVRGLFDDDRNALPEMRFSEEPTLLGTAGGIRNAAPALRGAGPILVHNGDFLSDVDISALLSRHRESGGAATLVLTKSRPGYSSIDVDAAGRVLSIAGKPEVERDRIAGSYMFTGMHVLDESMLVELTGDGPAGLVLELFRPLAEQGRLGSYLHDGFWWEFGSPALLLEGTLELIELGEEQRREIGDLDPVRRIGDTLVARGADAELTDGVVIEGRAAFGRATRIGEGSNVENSVVMAGGWIGPGCRLSRAVIGPGTEIPAGFHVRDAIVCADSDPQAALPPTVVREGGLLIRPLDEVGG